MSQTIFAAIIPSDNHVLLLLGAASKHALPAKGLRVLVWNLHKGENLSFENDFISLSKEKDLIISQEILLNYEMKKTFSELSDDQFSTATSFLMGKDFDRTGVAIGSRVPLLNSYFLRTKNLEPITNSPKMTLFNQYPIENQTEFLTVIDIHAINFVTTKFFKEEIDRIADSIVSLNILNHPLIFAGDFNSWSEERLTILNNLKNKFKLKEASYNPDFRLTFKGHPLDHVFYSQQMELISAKADKSYQGSDHKPLELVFDIKKQ